MITGTQSIIAVADPFSPTWVTPADAHETGLVSELFENAGNEAKIEVRALTETRLPDLVAERLDFSPDTAFASTDTIHVRLFAANRGDTAMRFNPDTPNVIAFYLDESGVAAVVTTTTIPKDSTFIVDAVLGPFNREGVFTLKAVVDALNVDQFPNELHEDNNAISRLLILGRVADLEVRSEEITITPAVPSSSGNATVSAKVRNVGETPVFNAVVEMYEGVIGPDPRSSSDPSRFIDRFILPRLDPGASYTIQAAHGFREGETHVIAVVADPGNTEREPNENNNRATRGVFVDAASSDTRVIGFSLFGFDTGTLPRLNSITVDPGTKLRIDGVAQYKNVFTGGSFVSGAAPGAVVTSVAIDSAGIVRASAISRSRTFGEIGHDLFAPVLPGVYTVRTRIDDGTLYGESTLQLVVSGFPSGTELVIDPSSIAFTPSALRAGESTTIRATVTNVGTDASSSVRVRFFADGTPLETSAAFTVPGAFGANAGSFTATVSVPSGFAAGLVTVKGEVEVGSGTDQLSNNTAETAVTVAASQPDLSIDAVAFDPVEVIEDRAETITVTVRNGGATPVAPGVAVRIVTANSRVDSAATVADTIDAFGGTASAILRDVIYRRAGADTIFVAVDPANTVAEADETNNSLLILVPVRSDTEAPVIEIVRFDTPYITTTDSRLHEETTSISWRAADVVAAEVFVTVVVEDAARDTAIRTLRFNQQVAESVVFTDYWDGRTDTGDTVGGGVYRFAVYATDPAGNVRKAFATVRVDNIGVLAKIDSPPGGAIILDTSGGTHRTAIKGSAFGVLFASYRLACLDSAGRALFTFDDSTTPVESATLGTWRTDTLPSDTYILRLVVTSTRGDTVSDETRVFLSKAARILLVPPTIVACTNVAASRGPLTARVVDAQGRPVPTELVRLLLADSFAALSAAAGRTRSNGFTDTLMIQNVPIASGAIARTAILTAGVDTVAVTETTAVRFVAGTAARIRITAAGSNLRADGVSTMPLAIAVFDTCGNAVSGETVRMTIVPAMGVLSETRFLSASVAIAETYTAPLFGADTVVRIVATLESAPRFAIKSDTLTLTLTGDAVDIDIIPTTALSLGIGETLALNVRVRNLSRDLGGETVEVRVSGPGRLRLDGADADSRFTTVTQVFDPAFPKVAGRLFQFRASTIAGIETIVARSLRSPALVETRTIVVKPGPAVRMTLDLPDTPRANRVDTARIAIGLFDTYGNGVGGASVNLTLSTAASGGFGAGVFGSSLIATTGPDGRTTKTFYTTTTPGTTIVTSRSVTGGFEESGVLAVLKPPADYLRFTVAKSSLRIDRSETTIGTIVVTDTFGNRLPGVAVRIDTTGAVRVLEGGSVTTDSTGAAVVTLAVFAGQSAFGDDTIVAGVVGSPRVADTRVLCAVDSPVSIRVESCPLACLFSVEAAPGQASLRITLTDTNGCGVPVETIRITTSDSTIVRTDADTYVTDTTGVILTRMRWDTKAGRAVLTFTVLSNARFETAPVEIAPGDPALVTGAAVPSFVRSSLPDTAAVAFRVQDRFGNALPGRALTFALTPSRAGSLSMSYAVTDAAGMARTTFTDSGNPLMASVRATDTASGRFGDVAIRVLGDLARLEFRPETYVIGANGETTIVLTANRESCAVIAVVALDSVLQRLPGETIRITVPAIVHPRGPIAIVSDTLIVTDSAGIARFTLCAETLAYETFVYASSARTAPESAIAALPPLRISLRAGKPERLTLVPDGDTLVAGELGRTVQYEARVTDTFGNPVPYQAVDFTYLPVQSLRRTIISDLDALDSHCDPVLFQHVSMRETPVFSIASAVVAGPKTILADLVSNPTVNDSAMLKVIPAAPKVIIVDRLFTLNSLCIVARVVADCPEIHVRKGEQGFLSYEVVDAYGNLEPNVRIRYDSASPDARHGRILVPDTYTDAQGRAQLAYRGETVGIEIIEIEAPDAGGQFHVITSIQAMVLDKIPTITPRLGRAEQHHVLSMDTRGFSPGTVRFRNEVPIFGEVADVELGESIADFILVTADHPIDDTMIPSVGSLSTNQTIVYAAPPESRDTGTWGIAAEYTDTFLQSLVDGGFFLSIGDARSALDTEYVHFTSKASPRLDHDVLVEPLNTPGCFGQHVFIDFDSLKPDTFIHARGLLGLGNVSDTSPSVPSYYPMLSMLINDSGGFFSNRPVLFEILDQQGRPWLHFGDRLGDPSDTDDFGRQTIVVNTNETGLLKWIIHVNPNELIDSYLSEGDTIGSQRIQDVRNSVPHGIFGFCVRISDTVANVVDTVCWGLGEPGGLGPLPVDCDLNVSPKQVFSGCSTPVQITGAMFTFFNGMAFPIPNLNVVFTRTPALGTVLQDEAGSISSSGDEASIMAITDNQGLAHAQLITGDETGAIKVVMTVAPQVINGFQLDSTTCTTTLVIFPSKGGVADLGVPKSIQVVYEGVDTEVVSVQLLDRCREPIAESGQEIVFYEGYLNASDSTGFLVPNDGRPKILYSDSAGRASVVFRAGTELRAAGAYSIKVATVGINGETILKTISIVPRLKPDTIIFKRIDTSPVVGGQDVPIVVQVLDTFGRRVSDESIVFKLFSTDSVGHLLVTVLPVTNDTGQALAVFTTGRKSETVYIMAVDTTGPDTPGPKYPIRDTIAIFVRPGPAESFVVSANPRSVRDNGTDTMLITITAYDTFGNLVPNQLFSVSINKPAAGFIDSAGITGANGTTALVFRAGRSCAPAVTVMAIAGTASGQTVIAVNSTPGALDLVSTPGSISVSDSGPITFQLNDTGACASPVGNAPVDARDLAGPAHLLETRLVTDAAGFVTFHLAADTRSGIWTGIGFAASDTTVRSDTVVIPILPLTAPLVLRLAADSARVRAGGETTRVVLSAVDSYGNALSGFNAVFSLAPVDFAFSDFDPMPPQLQPLSAGVDSAGRANIFFASGNTTGRVKVTALMNHSDTAETILTIVPAGADSLFLSISPDRVLADGVNVTTFTCTAMDRFGNAVAGESILFEQVEPDDTRVVLASALTSVSGIATIYNTPAGLPRTVRIVATAVSSRTQETRTLAILGAPARVTFSPDPVRFGVRETAQVFATVVDAAGGGVPNETVTFTVADGDTTLAAAAPLSPLVTDPEGRVLFSVNSFDSTGQTFLRVTDGNHSPPISGTLRIFVEAGEPSRVELTASPDSFSLADRRTADLTIAVFDAQGHPASGVEVHLSADAVDFGRVVTDGNGIATSTTPPAVAPGRILLDACAFNSLGICVSDTATVDVFTGPPDTIRLLPGAIPILSDLLALNPIATVRDRAGNGVPAQRITAYEYRTPSFFDPNPAISDTDGAAAFGLKLLQPVTVGESFLVTAFLTDTPSLADTRVVFVTGDPETLSVNLSRDLLPADGVSMTTVKIAVFDTFGHPVPAQIVTVQLRTDPDSGTESLNGAFSEVTDQLDGTYTAQYQAGAVPGPFLVRVFVGTLSNETRIVLSGDTTPPVTPAGLRIAQMRGAPPQGATATISWSPVDTRDVSMLELRRNGSTLARLPASTTQYLDTPITSGGTYEYALVAEDSVGNVSAPQAAPAVLAISGDFQAQALISSAANVAGAFWTFEPASLSVRQALEDSANAIGRSLGISRSPYILASIPAETMLGDTITIRLGGLSRSGGAEAYGADADRAWKRAGVQREVLADSVVETDTTQSLPYWALLQDATAPRAVIDTPAFASFVSASAIPIFGTAADTNFLRYSLFLKPGSRFGTGTESLVATSASSIVSGLLGTADLRGDTGRFTIILRADDDAGNRNEAFTEVTIDPDSPYVRIDAPLMNAVFRDSVYIYGAAVDSNLRQWTVKAEPEGFPESAYLLPGPPVAQAAVFRIGQLGFGLSQSELAIKGLAAEGAYVLRLAASDLAGQRAETSVRIFLDRTPPAIAVVPGDTVLGTGRSITVSALVTDTHNLAAATIRLRTIGAPSDSLAPLAGIVPATGVGTYAIVAPRDTVGTIRYSVTAVDEAGNADMTRDFLVTVFDAESPVAIFTAIDSTAEGLPTLFDARASRDSVGIVSYAWDFGDGTSGSGDSIYHIYLQDTPGIVTVRLRAIDAAGNFDLETRSISVLDFAPDARLELIQPVPAPPALPTIREGESIVLRMSFSDTGPLDNLFVMRLFIGDSIIEIPGPGQFASKNVDYFETRVLSNTSPTVTAQFSVTELNKPVTVFSNAQQIRVNNEPPSTPGIDLTPDTPRTPDELMVNIVTPSTDSGGDPIQYLYEWSLNGTDQPSLTVDTVSAALTKKGQVWRAKVQAWDGDATSPPAYDTVVIANTPPDTPGGTHITPIFRPFEVLTTSTLMGFVDTPSFDPDSTDGVDSVRYTYEWLKRGVLQPAFTTTTLALSATGPDDTATREGETWTLRVLPYDGDDTGPARDTTVTIVAFPVISPVVPNQVMFRNRTLQLDLTPFETDEEDTGTNLIWFLSDTSTTLFTAGSIDTVTDVLTLKAGTDTGFDTIILTLRDSRGLIDTQEVGVSIVEAKVDLKIEGVDTVIVKPGPQGDTVKFAVTVQNKASIVDSFSLSISGVLAGWRADLISVVDSSVRTGTQLGPNVIETFTLRVFVSPTADPNISASILVTATSLDTPTFDSALAIIVVKVVPDVRITTLYSSKSSYARGETALVSWQVSNFSSGSLSNVRVVTEIRNPSGILRKSVTETIPVFGAEALYPPSSPRVVNVEGILADTDGAYVASVIAYAEDTALPPLDQKTVIYLVGRPAIDSFLLVLGSKTDSVFKSGETAAFKLVIVNRGDTAQTHSVVDVFFGDTLVMRLMDTTFQLKMGDSRTYNPINFPLNDSVPFGQLTAVAHLYLGMDTSLLLDAAQVDFFHSSVRIDAITFSGFKPKFQFDIPTYNRGDSVKVDVIIKDNGGASQNNLTLDVLALDPFGRSVFRETTGTFSAGNKTFHFEFPVESTAFFGTYDFDVKLSQLGVLQHERVANYRVGDILGVSSLVISSDPLTRRDVSRQMLTSSVTVINYDNKKHDATPRFIVYSPLGETLLVLNAPLLNNIGAGQEKTSANNVLVFDTGSLGTYRLTVNIYDENDTLRATSVRVFNLVSAVDIYNLSVTPESFCHGTVETISYQRVIRGTALPLEASAGDTILIFAPDSTLIDTITVGGAGQVAGDIPRTFTRSWFIDTASPLGNGVYTFRVIGSVQRSTDSDVAQTNAFMYNHPNDPHVHDSTSAVLITETSSVTSAPVLVDASGVGSLGGVGSIDVMPPRTQLTVGSPGSRNLIARSTPLSLWAVDDLAVKGDSAGSGVAAIEYAVDSVPLSTWTAPVTLNGYSDGRHTFRYRSRDREGNEETERTATLNLDLTPPIITIVERGVAYSLAVDTLTVYYTVSDSNDPSPVVSASLEGPSPVPVVSGKVIPVSSLADGEWRLVVVATDLVGNTATARADTFIIHHDLLPPRTAAIIGSPSLGSTVGIATPITFVAKDDFLEAGDSAGLGVARTEYAIDSDPFVSIASAITLAGRSAGAHMISFRSVDRVAHTEMTQSITLVLDLSAPTITIADPKSGRYVAGRDSITVAFTYADAHDTAPSVAAELSGTETIIVANGNVIPAANLAAGRWVLKVTATDIFGNSATVSGDTFAVIHDVMPPRSTLAFSPRSVVAIGSEGDTFVTSATAINIQAVDDLIEKGDGIGLGVARSELAIDTDVASVASTTSLTGADGVHTVSYRSVDIAGNAETPITAAIRLDNTPPTTETSIETPSFADTRGIYVTSATPITFTAHDGGVGLLTAPTLTTHLVGEGIQSVTYRPADRLGNIADTTTIIAFVDNVPPVIALQVANPRADVSGKTYVRSATPILATATDTGAGVASFEKPDPPATSGPLTLTWRAADYLGNTSETSLSIVVDDSAPKIAILEPAQGAVFTAGRDALTVRVNVADENDSAPSLTLALRRTDVDSEIPVVNGRTIDPASLSAGSWELTVTATDFVGNTSTVSSGPFRVVHDILPPRTTAAIGMPWATGGADGSSPGAIFVLPSTSVALTAVDDLVDSGDSAGLGVARTEFSIDDAEFSTGNSASMVEADGPHTLQYRSVDAVGNMEASSALTLHLDGTPPTTTAAFDDSRILDGLTWAAVSARVNITSKDSGVGVARIDAVLDSGVWRAIATGTSLADLGPTSEGAHVLRYHATDLLGNTEAGKTLAFRIIGPPPTVTYAISGPHDPSGDRHFITPNSSVAFTATAASGLGPARIEVAINNGAFTTCTPPLSFSAEGEQVLRYRAVDRLGNVSGEQTLTLAVDNSAPVSTISIGESKAVIGTATYVTASTLFTLTAVDAPSPASGVAETRWSLDTTDQTSGDRFVLTGRDGPRTINYQAIDRLGNLEAPRVLNVVLDNTPPLITSEIAGPYSVDAHGELTLSATAAISLTASDTGSGLASLLVSVDAGVFVEQTSGAPIAFTTGGPHTLRWIARDRLGHTTSGSMNATVALPQSLPAAILTVDLKDTAGRVLIPESLIILSQTGTAAGITLSWRVDSQSYDTYASPFEIGTAVGQYGATGPGFGPHTLTYRVTDRVGNMAETSFAFTLSPALEVTKSRSFAPRVLLWWNYDFTKEGTSHDSAPPAVANRARIERAVRDESLLYDTVTARDSFFARMRSGIYNLFVILGDNDKLEHHDAEELAERINLGAGLVSSVLSDIQGPTLGHDERGGVEALARDNVLGVKVAGTFLEDSIQVQVTNGFLTDMQYTIATPVRPRRIMENIGETTALYQGASLNVDNNNNGHAAEPFTIAAGTRRAYGQGEALFFAFDIAKSANEEDGDSIADLVHRAVRTATPDTEPAIAAGTIAVDIRAKSLVIPMNLAVSMEELVPDDIQLVAIRPPAMLSGGAIVWTVVLDAGVETSVGYVLSLPSTGGTISTDAAISYLVRGIYRGVTHYTLDLTATPPGTELSSARNLINSLIPRLSSRGGDRAHAEHARDLIENIMTHPSHTAWDLDNAAGDLLTAIDDILRIEDLSVSADVVGIRLKLDAQINSYRAQELHPQ